MEAVDRQILRVLRRRGPLDTQTLHSHAPGLALDDLIERLRALKNARLVGEQQGVIHGGPTRRRYFAIDVPLVPYTRLTPREFTARFDALRRRYGVRGVCEMAGILDDAQYAGFVLSEDSNPPLREAILLAERFAEIMIKVRPYQLRIPESVDDELRELSTDVSFPNRFTAEAACDRLKLYGMSVGIEEVKKAMGEA